MSKYKFGREQLVEMLYDDNDDLRLMFDEAGEPHNHIQHPSSGICG